MFSVSHLTHSVQGVNLESVVDKWLEVCYNHLGHVQSFSVGFVIDITTTRFLNAVIFVVNVT